MATAFRIHEDVENMIEINKEKKHVIGKNNGNEKEKRPTFAVLNKVAFNNQLGTHAQKTAQNVLQTKNINAKANDENALPKELLNNAKGIDTKIPVDQFRAFSVIEDNRRSDENKPPPAIVSVKDEPGANVHNASYSGIRQPLQEIKQDVKTPLSEREILSPMSIDRSSLLESGTEISILGNQSITDAAASTCNKELQFSEIDEYREDILEYLHEAETRHRPKPMYMRKQPDINHSMRTILVDWLVEVAEEYHLQTETLCLAVSYIDRFLSVMSVLRAKLQLVGTAAMFIAAKYEEIYPPEVAEFVYITDHTYTKSQVLRMEQLILRVLSFDLCVPTTSMFLLTYPVVDNLPKEVKFLAQYLCELSLLDGERFLQYPPSTVSAASIALARFNFDLPIWNAELQRCTGFKIQDLSEIILLLGDTHFNASSFRQQAIQEKYRSSKYAEISTRIPERIDDIVLAKAIQQAERPEQNTDSDIVLERNENVRKMISSLLFD